MKLVQVFLIIIFIQLNTILNSHEKGCLRPFRKFPLRDTFNVSIFVFVAITITASMSRFSSKNVKTVEFFSPRLTT